MLYNWPQERAMITHPWVYWDGLFSDDQLDKIIYYCEAIGLERGTTIGSNDPKIVEEVRRCDLKFHKRTDENAWVFDKCNGVLETLNDRFYQFDLNGYDAFQYTTYRAEEKGEYNWHIDMCLGNGTPRDMIQPRKLSMSMLLNDPSEFDGGEFQLHEGNADKAYTIAFKRGRAVIFPSWMPHRVTPVTRGVRKSLVIWVTGPKFI